MRKAFQLGAVPGIYRLIPVRKCFLNTGKFSSPVAREFLKLHLENGKALRAPSTNPRAMADLKRPSKPTFL